MKQQQYYHNPQYEQNISNQEKLPQQATLEILNTQRHIEELRTNFFNQTKAGGSLLSKLSLKGIFGEPSFLDKHKPPQNLNDLIDLEGQIGGSLFDGQWEKGVYKSFFYYNNCWYLHVSNKKFEETTRFVAGEHGVQIVRMPQQNIVEEKATPEEAQNLLLATRLYHQEVVDKIYNPAPTS